MVKVNDLCVARWCYICDEGFEHHVTINPTSVAGAVNEAMCKYLGWDVYRHS
ncbi:MAG: hypothetical protein R3A10_18490 [Caldilineaceae bacterium]